MKRAWLSACLFFALGAGAEVCGEHGHYGGQHGSGTLRLCLARMDDKGVVQIREIHAGPPQEMTSTIAREKDGKTWHEQIKIKHTHVSEHIIHVDSRALKVLDTDNKAVTGDRLPELLQRETPVVLLDSERKIDPRLLPILKKGTLIVVLPMPTHGHRPVYNGSPVPHTTVPKKMPPAGTITPPPAKKSPDEKIISPPAKKKPTEPKSAPPPTTGGERPRLPKRDWEALGVGMWLASAAQKNGDVEILVTVPMWAPSAVPARPKGEPAESDNKPPDAASFVCTPMRRLLNANDVQVYRKTGERVDASELPRLLAKETHVLWGRKKIDRIS